MVREHNNPQAADDQSIQVGAVATLPSAWPSEITTAGLKSPLIGQRVTSP